MLEMSQGAFSYGTQQVFSGIQLTLEPKNLCCILGPNGCGKTTLLRCLSGMYPLNRGQVFLNGTDIAKMGRSAIAKKIGFVMQEQNNVFPFTVEQMITVGRSPYINLFSSPGKADEKIIDDTISKVGINHLRGKRFTELSGGEKQMVLIARVLTLQPEILLMDEPTSHLDFKNQALVMNIVADLVHAGMSIIMTTHFPNHAFTYATQVALMSQGTFIAQGKTDRVLTDENLSRAYDMPVKTYSVDSETPDKPVKFCVTA